MGLGVGSDDGGIVGKGEGRAVGIGDGADVVGIGLGREDGTGDGWGVVGSGLGTGVVGGFRSQRSTDRGYRSQD